MFTSKEHLYYTFGVDESIAKFFVDRKVPVNNRYWKGRYLYVASGAGYLFIPIFFDLQFKVGVSRECIMNNDYLKLMEEILHSAALHELEEIDFKEHLANCKTIMENCIKNHTLYNDLLIYFDDEQLKPYKYLGTPSKALNRADTFLFSVCFLDLNKQVTGQIVENWYTLISSFLLMDDISDLQEDKEKNEENSVNDFGTGSEGVEKAILFLRNNYNKLKTYNSKLGLYFENSIEKKLHTPYMQSLLNNG
jgi:hypothetical protein